MLIGYLAAVHVALAAGLASWAWHLEGDPEFVQHMRGVHARIDPTVPAGAVLFLGDSNIQSAPVSAIAPKAVNYGIGYQTADQLLDSMDIYRSMQRASAVVVMIGTNDIIQSDDDDMEAQYRAILAKVPPRVPVVLSSVPPMEDRDVAAVAKAAERACGADPRCVFADVHSALSRPGALLPDGVHLSPLGYQVLADVLRSALRSHAMP
jgi:lysophospholipase L1-like esterase